VSFADIRYRDPTQAKTQSFSFAEAIPAFTNHGLADQNRDLAASTIDPANTRLGSDLSKTSSTASRRDSAHASSATPSNIQTGAPETSLERAGFLHTESKSAQRARHAANQRHSKARNLEQASHKIKDANEVNTQANGKKATPSREEQNGTSKVPTATAEASRERTSKSQRSERDEYAANILRSRASTGTQWIACVCPRSRGLRLRTCSV
jgi:hypothetical protein